jgi:hypothetical protein
MRARQRHFNARDADAGAVFDARFISGVSNNTALSTWPDRSRNAWDATQSGAARPTYLASGLNGQAVVSCNSQFMPFNGQSLFQNKSAGYMLTICRSTSAGGDAVHTAFSWTIGTGSTQTRFSFFPKRFVNQKYFFAIRRLDADAQTVVDSGVSSTSHNVVDATADWANGQISIVVSGGTPTTAVHGSSGNTSNTASQSNAIAGNTSSNGRLIGEIALAQAFDSIPSAASQKRMRHAAAFSFKIACN